MELATICTNINHFLSRDDEEELRGMTRIFSWLRKVVAFIYSLARCHPHHSIFCPRNKLFGREGFAIARREKETEKKERRRYQRSFKVRRQKNVNPLDPLPRLRRSITDSPTLAARDLGWTKPHARWLSFVTPSLLPTWMTWHYDRDDCDNCNKICDDEGDWDHD